MLVAAVYFVSGKLSLLLAMPPGYATAIWPAAGVALSGVLLLGPRCLPGVWLGSFCVNAGLGSTAFSSIESLHSLAIAASVGIGASIQAAASAALVRRYVGWPAPLIRSREILNFMVVSGPVSCLIGATWGVSTLAVSGVVHANMWLGNWCTWWTGDTLGVWIFSILGLIAFGHPREIWQKRWRSVAVPVSVAFVMAVMVFSYVNKVERSQRQRVFEDRGRDELNRLTLALKSNEAVVHGLAGLCEATEHVDWNQFHTFSAAVLESSGTIEALAWLPRITNAARAEFEETGRQRGLSGFEIQEIVDGRRVCARERAEYFPALFVEMKEGTPGTLGFDTGSESKRYATLMAARDSGAERMSLPIRFNRSGRMGVYLTVPVYAGGADARALHAAAPAGSSVQAAMLTELRRQRFLGCANCAVEIDQLVHSVFTSSGFELFHLCVEDVTDPANPQLVYSCKDSTQRPSTIFSVHRWETVINVADRKWRMQFTPTADYLTSQQSLVGWAVLGGAFLFTSLLGYVLLQITGNVAAVELAVTDRTRELFAVNAELRSEIADRKTAEEQLRQTEERFRMAFEHSSIGMALIDLEGRWLKVNRALCEMVGLSEESFRSSSFQEITHPDDLEADLNYFRAALAGEIEHYQMEKRYLHSSGRIIWILLTVNMVKDSEGRPAHFVKQILDVTERRAREWDVKASLEEKEVLLREIHHRVKNNMQVISSLLQLQSGYLHDPKDVEIFRECQARIHAMGLAHDRLYRSRNLSTIDFGEHLRELAGLLVRGQADRSGAVRMQMECESVQVNLDIAIPLGLIAAELITNAFKHAFTGRNDGRILVGLSPADGGGLELRVTDDGTGFPEGFDVEKAPTLGLRLIRSLSRQLRATFSVDSQMGACTVQVKVPV